MRENYFLLQRLNNKLISNSMKNILVTGACGFIGSHIVEKLVKNGFNVTAMAYYNPLNSNGWLDSLDKKILKNIKIIRGDIRDYNFLHNNTKKIDIVLHLAALIGIPYSYHAPESYIDTNTKGTLNILNCALNNKISQVIITSTSEVYGSAKKIPIFENHSLNAQSPYAASKISADHLALSYYRSFDLPITILRPFNCFGPRQSTRAIIPTILSQILNKKNVKVGNLTPTRDFTYVEDTALAFLKAIDNKKTFGEIINIGNSFEISIKNIIKVLKNDFGYKFKVIIDKNRIRPMKSEVMRLYSSNKKAKDILKWEPKYKGINGFKKGLGETIKWLEDYKKSNFYNSDNYIV